MRKFTGSGFWSHKVLESACLMFAVPKHNQTQAHFLINLEPQNENTVKVKVGSPIPDMKTGCYRIASHLYHS